MAMKDVSFNVYRVSVCVAVLQSLQLDADGQYTVFAPSNLAFDKLQPSVRDKLQSHDGCGPGSRSTLTRVPVFYLVSCLSVVVHLVVSVSAN